VSGTDFRAVDEVLINNQPVSDFVVVSKTKLLVTVPDTLQNDNLVSLVVLSRRLTVTARSLLRFRLGKKPGRVSGILRLVQLYLKVLFTTQGTDIWNTRIGGNGLSPLGSTFGIDEGGQIVSDFVISIDQTTRQIVAMQSRQLRLPADERLLSARLLRAGFDKSEGALLVAVEITSQAGRAALASLEL